MELLVDILETIEAFLPFRFNPMIALLSSAILGLFYHHVLSPLGLHLSQYWPFLACFMVGYAACAAVGIFDVLYRDGAPIVFPLQSTGRWRVNEKIWGPCTSPMDRFDSLMWRKREASRRKRELLKHLDSSWRSDNLGYELAVACSNCSLYARVSRHTMLEYQDDNQHMGCCWLRLYPRGQRLVAIATDLTSRLHYGASITNMVETVALEICRQFRVAPKDLVLIEHYDRRGEPDCSAFGRDPQEFDIVNLDWDRRGKEFRHPIWHRLSLHDVERITGCARLEDWSTELVKTD